METKQPGYYRMLLENIEQEAAETVTEDKAQLMATTQAIKADLAKALASKDTNEIMRLVQGAHNSMDEVMLAIRRGAVSEASRRGSQVSAGMGTTLVRHKGTPDEEKVDVWIEFTGTMVSPGYAGDRYDPPHGPEWEFEINNIEMDLPRGVKPGPGDELTPDEKAEVTAWFDANQDRAEEVANDQMNDSY